MTRAAVTAIARRFKLDAAGTDNAIAEYHERMAICTIEGGLSEEEADVVAMEDVTKYAQGLAKGGGR
jgi:hypothetical protein